MSSDESPEVEDCHRHDGSDYGDFGDNEEELGIINDLLTQIESQQGDSALLVTDIEDYEAPTGLRLPKILGIEKLARQWEAQTTEDPTIHDTCELDDRSPPQSLTS